MRAVCHYKFAPFLRDTEIEMIIDGKRYKYKIEVVHGDKEITYKIPDDFPKEMFNVIFGHDTKINGR